MTVRDFYSVFVLQPESEEGNLGFAKMTSLLDVDQVKLKKNSKIEANF